MKVRINGEEKSFEEGTTLEALFALLDIEKRGTAVEVNREIVPKSRLAECSLREGDRVEIIRMVGGG